jgi:hypothetical protein
MSTSTQTTTKTALGPLSDAERVTIMQHAREMGPAARRAFRRLLILAQERGLTDEASARAAAQAREHA